VTTGEFIARLRDLNVSVSAEENRLRCTAPHGVLTPDLRAELASRKQEILGFLHLATATSSGRTPLIPLQPTGSRRPFFAVPGDTGNVFTYVPLARHLGPERPFYALQPPGLDGERDPLTSVEDLARYHVEALRAVYPEGPYLLGGYCAGTIIAFEMAQQLCAQGHVVALLALFGTPLLRFPLYVRAGIAGRYYKDRIVHHLDVARQLGCRNGFQHLRGMVKGLTRPRGPQRPDSGDSLAEPKARVAKATFRAVWQYVRQPYPGRITLYLASEDTLRRGYLRPLDWGAFAEGGLEVHVGPAGCPPSRMLREPHVQSFAELLRASLARAVEAPVLIGT
jgi:thioesterase domain-containing protein